MLRPWMAGGAMMCAAALLCSCGREAESPSVRARPVTALTTVRGLLPLALTGGPLWRPMACVIIFGLIFATCLTLLVLPSLYAVLIENLKVSVFERGDEEGDSGDAEGE